MSAILPTLPIHSDRKLREHFLPYQIHWILDDSPMRLAEKSIRVGWTYADAFKNVRKRLNFKNRDYLFVTKDYQTALDYVQTAHRHAEAFNCTKYILTHGIENWDVPVFKDGKATGFTEQLKVGLIKFDNGSRIIAFSSNPNALRAFGGDVGVDEFAFHPSQEELWASAQGRITWGYDIGVWSSHNGDDTLFYQFCQEAQAGKGRWSYYRVTIQDAVELGLADKINQLSGRNLTREQFIQDCKDRARLPDVFEQDYLCHPRGGTAAIAPWSAIANCLMDYQIDRVHLESTQIDSLFGAFEPQTKFNREIQIANYIQSAFHKTFRTPFRARLGFDVAASGQGDLAVIYVDEKKGSELILRALFTCRTEDWNFLKTVLWTFIRKLSSLQACGDETGLGRQICWETSRQFLGNRFKSVNFAAEKHNMGFALMNQLTEAQKRIPRGEPDIAADYFALRKSYAGKRWIFTEGRNSLNPASNCDIAWAGALASKADPLIKQIHALVG